MSNSQDIEVFTQFQNQYIVNKNAGSMSILKINHENKTYCPMNVNLIYVQILIFILIIDC